MSSIITISEFVNFEHLPFDNREDVENKMKTAIENAELDLQKVLGSDLFFDIKSNKATPSYSDLLEGSTFFKNGYEYSHNGIKSVLSKYTLSRYVYALNSNYTPFGLHERIGENSQNVNFSSIKEQSKQAQIDAGDLYDMVQLYLEANSSQFTAYNSSNVDGLGPLSNGFTFKLL